jgi:hypothetical protein
MPLMQIRQCMTDWYGISINRQERYHAVGDDVRNV